MTGAPVPDWADAVVKVEGTDAPAGASALPVGSVLGARSLSALAAIGYGRVAVVRRPRVGVVATGSELARPGDPLSPGMIPGSNSTLLSMLLREAGGEPTEVVTVADTAEVFAAALPTDVDLIVTSGGVSMGAFDPVKEYGLAHGWAFTKVAMLPGKPQGHGVSPAGVPVICLPGNPVSVAVSFRLFVRPYLARLLGQAERPARTMPAGAAWNTPAGANTCPRA